MPFTARFAAIVAVMLVGAHAATVGGTVLDSYTRQPVAYAEVALPDYGINLLTDSTGRFVTEVPDADQHVAVQQEADIAEHLLFRDPTAVAEHLTDAPDKGFAVGHGSVLRAASP